MFCSKCGKEIQKDWKNCPNCGADLKGKPSEAQNLNMEATVPRAKSRDEIKADLTKSAFTEKGSVVLFYGAGAISKDMSNVLDVGEELVALDFAHRVSIIGQLKSLRMFRDYIVCTNQRFLYIERGGMIFSLLPFNKKTVSIPYGEIVNVVSDKRIGIFSGKLKLEGKTKKLNLAMANQKAAEELRDFLIGKKTL